MVAIGFAHDRAWRRWAFCLLARLAVRASAGCCGCWCFSVLGPQIANQAGWFAAEVGRQPWIVYGLLRTSEGLSAVVKANTVLTSLILFTFSLPAALRGVRLSAQRQNPARAGRGRPDARPANSRCRDKERAHELRLRSISTSIWFILVGVLFTGYAMLDGFDLGVGALHLFTKKDEERRIMLNAIGPVWDGNEVWLVTGGGALFAAFPECLCHGVLRFLPRVHAAARAR